MLILASKSPRREELLREMGYSFLVIPSLADEVIDPTLPPDKVVQQLAKAKALDVLAAHPDDRIIGADTIVCCDQQILGKPKDADDASRMLALLSGRTHSVYTGVAIAENGIIVHSFVGETLVEFYPLFDEDIEWYVATGEPFDKAGAYGIQGKGAYLVKRIDGDFYNVMGLPIAELARYLK